MIKAAYGAYPTPEYVVMALTTDIVSLILVECTGSHLIPLKMKIEIIALIIWHGGQFCKRCSLNI